LACQLLVSSADQDVQARFEKSLSDAKSLPGVEIEYLDTLSITNPAFLKMLKTSNGKGYSRTFQYMYISSGLKYRATEKLISGTESNLVMSTESAFDGKSYYTYDGETRAMTKNGLNEPPEGLSHQNPLIAPFAFLTKLTDDGRMHILRFTDIISEEFTKGFALPTGLRTNGLLEITIPGLPAGGQTTLWKIAIDESGDSFTPKSVESICPGRGIQSVSKLLDYTNLGAYQFPSRIEWAESSYTPTSPPTSLSSGTVTLISARISEQTTDSDFELKSEEKLADSIWDWAQKNFVRVAAVYPSTNACAAYSGPIIYDESADSSKEIAEAIDTAKKEQKRVLLQFGANWSDPCHELHELFQTNKDVSEELKKDYVDVMVDVNRGHNADNDEKFGHPAHFTLPVLVILDSDGKRMNTENTSELLEGHHYSPEKVIAFLEQWAKNN
jgi:hypothetical protein